MYVFNYINFNKNFGQIKHVIICNKRQMRPWSLNIDLYLLAKVKYRADKTCATFHTISNCTL